MDRHAPYFRPGGTLEPGAQSYIVRAADQQLFDALLRGEYVFLLDSRQKGKSSLVARTILQLRDAGIRPVKLDLQRIGANVTPEQWYAGLAVGIGQELGFQTLVLDYWQRTQALGPMARFLGVIHEVILKDSAEQIAIFIDEIDFVRALDFSTDEFFGGIRECYNRRSSDEEFKRLSFCLVGVATPGQLIRNPDISPFNIGVQIDLTDFSLEETAPYSMSLASEGRDANKLIERVHYWVAGHPYLTQLICGRIAADRTLVTPSDLDKVVTKFFLSPEARQREPNLSDVERRLLSPDVPTLSMEEGRIQVLELYGQMLKSGGIDAAGHNPVVATMRLSGAATEREGRLRIRNRLYGAIFDENWRQSVLPDAEIRRQRGAARVAILRTAAVASIGLALFGGAAVAFWRLSDERSNLITGLEAKTEELKRQNYIAKMGSMRYAMAAGLWTQVAEVVQQTQNDPYRNWEWGHAALITEPDFEATVTDNSLFEVQANGELMVVASDGLYELTRGGARLFRKFPPMNGNDNPDIYGRPVHGVGAHGGAQPMPRLRRGSLRVRQSFNPWGDAIFDAESDRILIPPKAIQAIYDVDPVNRRYLRTISTAPNQMSKMELRTIDGDKLVCSMEMPVPVLGLYFLPGGRFINVCTNNKSDQKMELRRWDYSGRPMKTLMTRLSSKSPHGYGVEISPDSSMYALYGDVECELRSSRDDHVIATLPNHPKPVYDLGFSRDGKKVVTGCNDGIVRLFDLQTTKMEREFRGRLNGTFYDVEFLPDGKQIASIDRSGRISVWNIEQQPPVETFADTNANQGRLTRDGKSLISASVEFNGRIVSRNLVTGKISQRNVGPEGKPHRAKEMGPMDAVFYSLEDGSIVRLAADTLKEDARAKVFGKGEIGTWALPGDRYLFAMRLTPEESRGAGAILDARSLKTVARIEKGEAPVGTLFPSFACDQNGSCFAVASGPRISVFSIRDGGLFRKWKLGLTAFGIALSPDGTELAVSVASQYFSTEYRIELYNTRTGEKTGVLSGPGDTIWALEYSPNGNTLAAISRKGFGYIWDLRTMMETAKLAPGNYIGVIHFSPDGERLVTSGSDCTSTIWDPQTGTELMSLVYAPKSPLVQQGVNAYDTSTFSADGRDLVTVCADGSLRIWHSLPWKDQPKVARK